MPNKLPLNTDDLAAIDLRFDKLEARVTALETPVSPPPPPPPPPVVPPPPPAPTGQLLGGYRIQEAFAQGCLGVDWAKKEGYFRGFDPNRGGILIHVLDLSIPMGTGSDVLAWPVLPLKRHIDTPWWPIETVGDCYGLAFWQGKIWCNPRKWYDTAPRSDMDFWAIDGEKLTVDFEGGSDAQRFDGFVKDRFGNLWPGGGGYDSGQGSVSGPTLGTFGGQTMIWYEWPALPGPNLENWNKRAPRPTNYSIDQDDWVAWNPRMVNGVMEGRWASDAIMSGGLKVGDKFVYHARLGTGRLGYSSQSLGFDYDGELETWQYEYDAATYKFLGYFPRLDLGYIIGQDIDPDGKQYLVEANAWKGITPYKVDPVLKVFSA